MTTYTMTARKATTKGYRAQVWTVEDVFAFLPENGDGVVLWASFGHVNGQECFGRSTYRRDGESVAVHCSDGRKVVGYPLSAGRTLRILVK